MEKMISKQEIMTSRQGMEKYLEDVYTMEKNLYTLREEKDSLEYKIEHAGEARITPVKKPNLGTEIGGEMGTWVYYLFKFIIGGAIAGFLFSVYVFFSSNNFCVWRLTGIGAELGFVLSFLVPIYYGYNSYKQKDYEYEYNKKALAKDAERISDELAYKPVMKNLLEECRTSIKKTEVALDEVYSMNIVFPKYRSLVAVSQMFEYFASGRCTELGGSAGAYNLYEQELRMNIVISKMDEIISELEEIKANQYMLYAAIQQTNQLLSKITDNTAVAAYNAEVVAYNTTVSNRYNVYTY